jgi:glycerol-3-phosphate dehydrogenase
MAMTSSRTVHYAAAKGESVADFDLAIIGGGINGTGIARDAAGRGLSVVLFEQSDLASGTSSASSKLIHGGLRYLEHREFRLVREALAEREVLLRMAPHLIQPLRFVLPLREGMRSPALLRFGLFLYDWIGGRRILQGTRSLDLIKDEAGLPLRRHFHHGYEYSDCLADDARLVVLTAVDAAERGAVIRTRTRCVRAERGDEWRLILNAHGQRDVVTAHILINAAGPWVGPVAETIVRQPMQGQVRLDMGSHIVMRKLYDHDRAYLLQAADGRIVFTIPFERDFTLIGTTDRAFDGDPAAVAPDGEDILYLCTVANDYFRASISAADAVWAYAGVRALYDDGARKAQDIGREYVLKLDEGLGEAPLLTVFGGKITTHRRLAEAAMASLAHFFPPSRSWTAKTPLPGGDFAYDGLDALVERTRRNWAFLGEAHARRLVRTYGTRVDRVIGTATKIEDLGMSFGADLTAAEVRYLMTKEWAQTADDVLWRRSKLGLRLSDAQKAMLARFMAEAKN